MSSELASAAAPPSVSREGSASRRSGFERARRWVSALLVVGLVVASAVNRPPDRGPAVREFVEAAGVVLLMIASLGRVWAGVYVNGRKSRELCREGPYSLTRNPLYLFSLVGLVGALVTSDNLTLAVAAGVAFVIYYHFVIADEERRLADHFGQAFAEYRREVPRLLPLGTGGYVESGPLTIQPRTFVRAVRDASVFLLVFAAIEATEGLLILAGTAAGAGLTHLP